MGREPPLYPVLDKMLSEADPNYKEVPISEWNFTKFLVNKKGQVVPASSLPQASMSSLRLSKEWLNF